MNSFLKRVMAPGLRRAGSGFAPPQKAEPAIVAPLEAEPTLEEIAAQRIDRPPVEEQSIAPTASPPSRDEAGGREGVEVGAREEKPSPFASNEPETQAGEHAPAPEILFQPPSPTPPFLEEKVSFQPAPTGPPRTGDEKPKRAAEILSFETVEFNPAAPYPSMRRFQPSGEKGRVGEDSDRSEPAAKPDRTAAREIVWEVVPADRPIPRRKESVGKETPRPQGERSEPPISDRMQPSSSSDRPPQTAKKEEHRLGPLTQSQAAPIRPREATLPRPTVRPKEEKGDLIIEQLEVRVVAEPERRPQPPKARPAAPKRSGAWETAARYYLGKV